MPRYNPLAKTDLARFAEQLKMARTDQGISQAELAALIGLKSQGSVGGWETGEKEPEREHVFRCEEVLNLEPGTLSSLLGYGPPVVGKPGKFMSLRRAILSDDKLSKAGKEAMLATYRALTSSSRCTVLPLEAA